MNKDLIKQVQAGTQPILFNSGTDSVDDFLTVTAIIGKSIKPLEGFNRYNYSKDWGWRAAVYNKETDTCTPIPLDDFFKEEEDWRVRLARIKEKLNTTPSQPTLPEPLKNPFTEQMYKQLKKWLEQTQDWPNSQLRKETHQLLVDFTTFNLKSINNGK